jgi:hypothetical protein
MTAGWSSLCTATSHMVEHQLRIRECGSRVALGVEVSQGPFGVGVGIARGNVVAVEGLARLHHFSGNLVELLEQARDRVTPSLRPGPLVGGLDGLIASLLSEEARPLLMAVLPHVGGRVEVQFNLP